MAYLTWTDDIGSATLSNVKPHKAGRRLTGWVSDVARIADRKTAMGTGITHEFLFRLDYVGVFVMDKLPVTQFPLLLRFKNYAASGCSFYLYTEDASDRVYLVRQRPGSDITFEQHDPTLLEYAMHAEVISAAAPVEPLLCFYRE